MEQTYKDWEQAIIANFYKKPQSQHSVSKNLQPTDGRPVYAYKNKVMLVVNFICPDGIDTLAKTVEKHPDLPERTHVTMYHLGNKSTEGVSSGLKGNEVSFPVIDVGGLTTYRHIVGTPSPVGMKSKRIRITSEVTQKTIDAIYQIWKKYAGKDRFYGNVKAGLALAIRSINMDAYIQFYKVPVEYRVICTSNDIFKHTGHYYNRLFGNPKYAKEVKPKEHQYCAITGSYITPNINRNNLLNEYSVF
jgi:hypothetical protein